MGAARKEERQTNEERRRRQFGLGGKEGSFLIWGENEWIFIQRGILTRTLFHKSVVVHFLNEPTYLPVRHVLMKITT